MFDMEERRRDEDLQRSEAVVHLKREHDTSVEKLPDAYKPHWSERDEQTRPYELFCMGNSYTDVSFATNRRQEMLLVLNQKRRADSETLDNDRKLLNGERRRTVPTAIGRAYTNSFDPRSSAFTFKTGKFQPPKRILAYIKQQLDKIGQDTVETSLPFLNLHKDKKRLQEIRAEIAQPGQGGKDLPALEEAEKQLAQAITRKEQMQSNFLKKMDFAQKKARLISEREHPAWLNTAVLTTAISPSETPPETETDPVEDPSGTNEDGLFVSP